MRNVKEDIWSYGSTPTVWPPLERVEMRERVDPFALYEPQGRGGGAGARITRMRYLMKYPHHPSIGHFNSALFDVTTSIVPGGEKL